MIRWLFSLFARKRGVNSILKGFEKTLKELDRHAAQCDRKWKANVDKIDRLRVRNQDLDAEIVRTQAVRDNIADLIKE